MKVTEKQHDEAVNTLRAEYYTAVRDLAQDLIAEVKAGELAECDLSDAVHERVDGSEWVIYTHRNHQVIFVSDNPGAYADEFGAEGLITNGDINWPAVAYAAMCADVHQAIEAYRAHPSE